MVKMIIKMDEESINSSKEYSIEAIYATMDKIFQKRDMEKILIDGGFEYCGKERPTDFGFFGQIVLGLKKQNWFMNNVKTWLLCTNDDVDNPKDFSEEDLLAYYSGR